MHIGFNAHLLSAARTYRAAGIKIYIHNLLLNITELDRQIRYTVFLSDRRALADHPSLQLELSHLPTTTSPVARILWEQLVQPIEVIRLGIDLLHSLAFVQPLLRPCLSVVTIHDLSFILFPASFRRLNRLYLSHLTRLSVKEADMVIAVSQNTKRDLVRLFGLDEEKVCVIYHGTNESFQPIASHPLENFRKRRGLPESFILFVGTMEPRKNLERLLEAFAQVKKDSKLPHKLVIAGPRGWFSEKTLAAAERLGLEDEVLFSGYIPQKELPFWYNAAQAFVYPSLYEGFGLPVMEAMACGVPVITSNTSSLPEVVGEAGVKIDPYSVEELSRALQEVLTNKDLRSALIDKGLAQAKKFSWRKAAQETLAAYERAIERGGKSRV